MRYLVTGGAGFIGAHLCKRLLEQGHTVACLDNFSTGSRANIAALLDKPGFQLLERDVRDPLGADGAFDCIFNLACPASPVHYQADPVGTLLTNVVGTKNMLDVARRCNAVFVQASTSEVYGEPLEHPQAETYRGNVNPHGPRACYDEGKRAAEALCFDYLRTYGTRVKVARIFNTYGPGMSADDGRVVSNLIVQALRGQALTVYGTGSQTRCFCYIDDLVEGLLRLSRAADDLAGPVNLGNPTETTVEELACLVRDAVAPALPIEHLPLPADDPTRRRPCIDRARAELGWEPQVPLAEGLARTVAYFQEALAL